MVSIIIPLYNVERYVEQMLHSLFTQSYADCEFIVVDDCSTDGTMALFERVVEVHYRELKGSITVVENGINRGIFLSRINGLKAAKGDYIIFVDGDDICDKEMVSTLVAAASEADIVTACYCEYDGSGRCSRPLGAWSGDGSRALQMLLTQGGGMGNNLWGVLYRRTLFAGIERVATYGITLGEDFVMKSYALSRASRVVCIDDILYRYRVGREGSYMSHSAERWRSYFRAFILSWRVAHPEGGYRRSVHYRLGRLNLGRWLRVRRGGSYLYRLFVYALNKIL